MSGRRGAWDRYRTAAVEGAAGERAAGTAAAPDRLRMLASGWWSVEAVQPVAAGGRWRDLRLVPLGAAAWLGAAVGPFAEAASILVALLAASLVCAAAAATVAFGCRRSQVRRPHVRRPHVRTAYVRRNRARAGRDALGRPAPASARAAGLAVLATCSALAGAAGLAAAGGHGAAERAGPVGELLARGGSTVATVEVRAEPTPLRGPSRFGTAPRFGAEGRILRATDAGRTFAASSAVRLIGGSEVRGLRPGTTVEVAGRVVPATQPGRPPLLSTSSRPRVVGGEPVGLLVGEVRGALRASSAWLAEDAAGLLPGMAVGDTAALPQELEDAMRQVGLGHLTAVSGANFTLLSASVLLALRAARAPRPAAAAASCAVLAAFALVVGPEASVLRAAAMGAVGLVALVSGRAGRSCSSLSGAVLVLVLLEPDLALSMGFLLSVAATLGIALLGPPLTGLLAARLPTWLAVGVAVPLSAQLMCGPLMVLIQPSFLSLSLVANVVVAPFVPLVAVAGTLALATCPWCPPMALVCTAVGGAAAQAVAAVARLLASLPGAALPWPEGLIGTAVMAAVSAANAVVLWAALSSGRWRAVLLRMRGPAGGARAAAAAASGLGPAARRGRVDG
jgi:competence protein ComEC